MNGNHWCLAVINFMEKKFEYYDSLGGENLQALRVEENILFEN